jgi:hypothetical protein
MNSPSVILAPRRPLAEEMGIVPTMIQGGLAGEDRGETASPQYCPA